ncbi:MAG: dCMP deaminase family protein [Patescibacteria group bacterium]|jgi:dCMP deaminase|nr:dCMP deaminase family protein [Patescibacteria group bacterium]
MITKLTKSTRRKKSRPDIDSYFLKMALIASERSTCRRHSVGAVLVKDKIVLSTGYNGAAKGAKDCLELGCLRDELGIKSGEKHEVCRAIHAEQNAIIQGSSKGVVLNDSIMYCTHTPCNICAKMMANAGVKEVVVFEEYSDNSFKDLFKELSIKVTFLPRPDLNIEFFE